MKGFYYLSIYQANSVLNLGGILEKKKILEFYIKKFSTIALFT